MDAARLAELEREVGRAIAADLERRIFYGERGESARSSAEQRRAYDRFVVAVEEKARVVTAYYPVPMPRRLWIPRA